MTSYSQGGQDLWVFEMTEGKTNGFYLDIGCNDAKFHSNTYGLEEIGWNGLLVDIIGGCETRRGNFVRCDASKPDGRLTLHYKNLPTVVDYLSLDCDDATLGAFKAIPWGTTTFRAITIETDVYRKGPGDRSVMRNILEALGYTLVCADVVVEWPEGQFVPYEDWFAHPDLVNMDLIKRFTCSGKYWKDILKL